MELIFFFSERKIKVAYTFSLYYCTPSTYEDDDGDDDNDEQDSFGFRASLFLLTLLSALFFSRYIR